MKKTVCLLFAAALSLVVCAKEDTDQYIPQSPDYQQAAMWYASLQDAGDKGADVFYIVSTWEMDWKTNDGRVCHYADVWNPVHREHMAIEMGKIAGYMAEGNHFYAPYYRHLAIDSWMTQDNDTIQQRVQLAMSDVKKAFDQFLQVRDPRRPFVLAGFSQGGLAVVELLKYMSDETYKHLVAAYVLGYKVTPQDTLECPRIRAAKDSADIGVTICYNTVKDVKYVKPILSETCMGINPVNWRIDATPAILHDTITVTLDPQYHVLVVKGYSGAEYPAFRDFLNVGDIHSCEPWLYSECLKKNIALRVREWRKKNKE